MKIVINTRPLLSPLTGVSNYTFQVASQLSMLDKDNVYSYFYGSHFSKKLKFHNKEDMFPYLIKKFLRKFPPLAPSARWIGNLTGLMTSNKFKLYFEPNFIPVSMRTNKRVVTIHDFSWKIHSEWHPKERVRYLERNFWRKIDSVDSIIVVSDFIKTQAIEEFALPSEKIHVIHNGFDPDVFKEYNPEQLKAIREKFNLPQNFVLFVGSIEPRKNLKNLICAYLQLNKNIRQKHKLVLVGFKGWNNKDIMQLLDNSKEDVEYLGYVSNEELGKLYNLATVFAYPSFYEGFGLPPLEAMASGCPVVTSNAASLPEVCGDAAYYIDPYDIDSISQGIHRVITDKELRNLMVQKGLAKAAEFSWTKSAQQHLKLFTEVAGN